MPEIRVQLADRPYSVRVERGGVARIGELVRGAGLEQAGHAALVVDEGLPKEVVAAAHRSLEGAGFAVGATPIRASESNKSMDTVMRIVHDMADARHERWDPLVALGGGIVGDVAGFAAAIYRRGVPVVQCPTTLLAMVDASVGGKTGVNLPVRGGMKKNLLGAFWQPRLVIADPDTLDSLDDRMIRSGLAECIKHGLISRSVPRPDPDLFEWTNQNLIKLRMRDGQLLEELIARNIAVKAGVVERDEREEAAPSEGGRALLNLGHTFAHAIETIPHLSPDGDSGHAPLQHGEAVAYGLVAAAACSRELGGMSKEGAERVRIAVERLGMESRLIGLPTDEAIIDAMFHDKKVAGGRLRLVLPTGIGEARIVESPSLEGIQAGLAAIRTVG